HVWNHFRASLLSPWYRVSTGRCSTHRAWGCCGVGSGTLPQDVLCSPSTPERQSLFESHRQRRWLTIWSYPFLCNSMSSFSRKKLSDSEFTYRAERDQPSRGQTRGDAYPCQALDRGELRRRERAPAPVLG